MNALGTCGAPPLPSPAPDASPAAAPESAAASATGGDATGIAQDHSDGDSATVSFQQMMNQAQVVEPVRTGSDSVAATLVVAATAVDTIAADNAAGMAATAASDALAQLLQLSGQNSSSASTASATPAVASAPKKSDRDSDADTVPQDDALALVLSALSQLGIALQTATPAAAAANDSATALTVAADGVAAQLAGALPKPATGPIDALAARLRSGPALTLAATANGVATGNALQAGSLLQSDPSNASITLRDLLDGSGGDAAARMRDPAEAAVSARADAAAGMLATAANDTSRSADAVTRTISIPVQHPRWAEAVSTQIRWFAEQGVQSATLRLTPEHLGPVEVRLSLSDSQVTVNFTAGSAETRAALEQSLPRLRDMLAGAGLSLGEAQVQQQMRQGSQNGFNSNGPTADTDVRDSLARVPMRLGLVDEYA